MKKRVSSILLALLLILTMVPTMAWAGSPASAAPEQTGPGVSEINAAEGRTFQTAKEISFGSTYYNYWTTDNDHLCYYIKFTVPERGKVDFYFTKPFDAEGEYGKLEFVLYKDDADNQIWTEDCWYLQYNASDRYSFTMGLNPGTYYLSVMPGFYVTSGLIETNFKFTFTATNAYEVEPNASASQATVLSHGIHYGANFGGEDENDYFRFAAQAGKDYKIYIGNFARITPTTIIIRLLSPSGKEISLSYQMESQGLYDDDGDYYLLSNAEAGNYTIRVENYHQAQIHYTVGIFEPGKDYGPPSITSQPSSVTVASGDVATFTVGAKGSDLSYQWEVRTSSSGSWSSTGWNGNKTNTLKVTASMDFNGYQYRCRISNGFGTVYSSAVTLSVVSAPSITSQPKSVSANEGTTVSFSVSATGGNLSYRWQYRTSSTGNWLDYPDGTSSTLRVTASSYRNGYQYRCKVSNSLGTVYSSIATLTVIALSVTSQPKSVSAYVGDTATFSVTAQGSNLSYQWQYKTATGSNWLACPFDGNQTRTLSVPVTAARDGYRYRCKISNASGSTVYSNAAKLTVKTKITSQPANASAAVGNTAKFTVKATGPSLTYQWQYKTAGGSSWLTCSMTGNKTATLSVPVTAARNGYQYRCKVTSGSSTVYSSSAKLTVKTTVTSQPSNAAVAIDGTAKFTVKATGAGLKYQWQYKTVTGSSWLTCSMTGNKTATLSVPVTAARNGYQYRCKITDANGTVTYSNAAKLTVKTKIVSQPANTVAEKGSTAKFTVKATGVGLTYQWQYKTATGSSWLTCSMDGNKTATLSVPVTAARNGYAYRCKITDANGNVTYSTAATLTVIA